MPPGPATGLGGIMEERDPTVVGLRPGQMYAGGPQTQQQGLRGQVSQDLMRRWDHLFRGKDPKRCGIIWTHECADIISRLLEQTFRNFQITGRRPSHIDPPFSGIGIDQMALTVFNNAVIPTTLLTFPMPAGNFRGVIRDFGLDLETAGAFFDVTYRILIDGVPISRYAAISGQLSPFTSPSALATPIHLRGGQVLTVDALSVSGAAHQARVRAAGWFYPVRVEMDNSIGSTLVD
jgi:hypothetical protein